MRRLVALHIVVGPMDDGLEMTNLTTVIQSSNISSNKKQQTTTDQSSADSLLQGFISTPSQVLKLFVRFVRPSLVLHLTTSDVDSSTHRPDLKLNLNASYRAHLHKYFFRN